MFLGLSHTISAFKRRQCLVSRRGTFPCISIVIPKRLDVEKSSSFFSWRPPCMHTIDSFFSSFYSSGIQHPSSPPDGRKEEEEDDLSTCITKIRKTWQKQARQKKQGKTVISNDLWNAQKTVQYTRRFEKMQCKRRLGKSAVHKNTRKQCSPGQLLAWMKNHIVTWNCPLSKWTPYKSNAVHLSTERAEWT